MVVPIRSKKFATCTLLGAALTWWNGQIRTLGPEAYAMTWEVLKRKMTDKYCPQGEIKKLEIELWNLKVRGNDVPAYTERFQELTLICTKFVANETEKIDKYLSGLPDNIYGNVKAAKPKTLDETIELANDLMDRKLLTYAERQSDNKRKADDSSRNNHGHQQQPFKRQNVARVYNMGTGERKPYGGSLPKCNKCHLHHNGPCTQRCHKCNKIGHFARDCRSTGNPNVANTQKGNGATPKGNGCFECGAPGHFKRDCPKLKNKNGGNGNAQGWVYAVGNAEKRGNAPGNPDANVVTGTFLLNNHYASILFDTGADRSFISTAFSSLINIAPTSLENCYDVELAVDTIIRGCTLNFLDHPFNIDLMPVELGSFDVIIGMDWLRRYHAVIVCDEKLVQIPYGNKTLTFCGNEGSNGRESRLTVISCSKAQEYMAKGCQVFLAQISTKKEEDKSERKQIEDVPIVRDFPEVFPEDLPGLPPARPVEFQIDLIPGAAPVARAPYRLAPSEMKELSEQLQELSDKGFIRPSSSPWGAPVLFVKKKDDNVGGDAVMFLGEHDIGHCLVYENVDPSKVRRGNYVECMELLLNPYDVYLDCHMMRYMVPNYFWRQLVPHLCMPGSHSLARANQEGWLSNDHMNAWMELLIRGRTPNNRWTVSKSGTLCVHLENKRFMIETDQHIIGTLDGSTHPYPAWSDVDWVYMPINAGGNHWVTGAIDLSASLFYVYDSLHSEGIKYENTRNCGYD
ncbi:putative reverse transcriptase domain-containing protein [Tanacetum coccineum]